ncbi:hypothetical protein G5B37_11955 [Rasiella rasia]|uniref:Peptidase C14 caspase domain-containing protein n=1 Tax=Rasiella rasia TaxID=2744027 RepID=A0A6G6GNX1_9FLAO|nr:caspase family protein [Rasiella rasia]QIE60249.1 hypothetical protein G5B37_11955 [Rasiella rasia]
MRQFIKILGLLLLTFSAVAQDKDIVVQSMHAEGSTFALLDNKRNLLVTYGYKDQTLKFWNRDTGFLYHTEDLGGYGNDFEINTIHGKTYALVSNTVLVYDNTSFKEIGRYPLGRIHAMHFHQTGGEGYLMVYADDVNGAKALYILNEESQEFVSTQVPVFPGEGEISHFEINSTNSHLWIATNFMENYFYSFATGEFINTKDYVLGLMDDGDAMVGVYSYNEKKASFYRYNYFTKEEQWVQTLQVDLPYATVTPYRGDLKMNSDGKSMWVAPGSSLLVELDANSGYIMGKIYREEEKRAMLSDGDLLYVQSGVEKPYAKFKRYEAQPITEFGFNLLEASNIGALQNNDGTELVATDYYGHPYSFLFNQATTRFTKYAFENPNTVQYNKLLVDSQNKRFYAIPNANLPIRMLETGKPNSVKSLLKNVGNVQYYDFEPEKQLMASLGGGALRIVDIASNSESFIKLVSSEVPYGSQMVDLSPSGNFILYSEQTSAGDVTTGQSITYFDYVTKQELWTKTERYSGAFHINNGAELLLINGGAQQVEIVEARTGTIKRTFPIDQGKEIKMGALSPNAEYLVFTGYQLPTSVYEVKTGKRVNQFKSAMFDYFEEGFVTETIVAVPASGAIKFIDILNNKEVLRMYIFQDDEWIAHTPDGLFDGSQGAWNRVAFANGNQSIPLESVFDNFYTPRLLHKVLKGGKLDIPKRDIKNLKKAPTVSMTYKEGSRNLTVEDDAQTVTTQSGTGEITVTANANGDRITELRLYQNGKLLRNNTRNLVVEDDVPVNGNSKVYSVKLVEGLNQFVAIAVNSQNTESRPDRLEVVYQPAKSDYQPKGMQAHIMVVGIDTYKNPKYNLNYAVADANSFMQSIRDGVKDITSKVNVYEVKNDQAIRDNIISKFTEIASTSNPQDIFIFYYAGHGVVSQDAAKEFYLVPHDVTQLYGDDGALKQKGVSAKELKQISSGIPAQKQLFILDACQSAGALNSVALRGAAEEKAIAQLARSTGTHWLTASGSEQYATEFDELGHGVFTYALLEALSGKADSGDKRITVNEIKAYIESRVPEISEKYKGSPQYPSSFGFGQDFPVGVKQ